MSFYFAVSDSRNEGAGSSMDSTRPASTSVEAVVVQPFVAQASCSSELPANLFAWGCYPTKLRLNIYTKAHIIGTVASSLAGSEDLD